MAERNSILILGVMTGNSCDAIDLSLIEFTPGHTKVLGNFSRTYPGDLRRRVLEIQQLKLKITLSHLGSLDRALGIWMGKSIAAVIKPLRRKPDAIAIHGQTIGHFPKPFGDGFSFQIGNPAQIAEITGITTLSHFRDGDLAAGGQGAPLVPSFQRELIRKWFKKPSARKGIALHNLGGISNLTYFLDPQKTLAFDTGPGNLWIDAAVERITRGKETFDRGGKWARRGKVDSVAVEQLLQKHPFFSLKPPKSTGRDELPFQWFLKGTQAKGADLVATATEVTARSIAMSYEKWITQRGYLLHEVIFFGGGAKNHYLLQRISELLGPQVRIRRLEDYGLDSQYLEAQSFAWLGFLSLLGKPLGGSWTGSQNPKSSGWITPSKNWPRLALRLKNFI
jgi:anhydro-N-acetylmuramic acid kinase